MRVTLPSFGFLVMSLALGCTPPEKRCAKDRLGNLKSCLTACEQGDMPSCLASARTFDQRFEETEESSEAEQALQYYEKSCNAGMLEACFSATHGILLGPSREKPDLPQPTIVANGPERRRKLLVEGCGLDDRRFCFQAADAYLGEDRGKAEQLGRKACVLEFGDRVKRKACESERVSLALDAEQGAMGCEEGRPGGCLTLGEALLKADRIRAREAFALECKRRRILSEGKVDACVRIYETASSTPSLPAAEPSIIDRLDARVILRSLALEPSKPERPSPEHVREVIDTGTKNLAACYAAALHRNPKLSGSLTLRFTIDAFGHPWNVREEDLRLVDVQVVECVRQRVSAWRFDEPRRDTVEVEARLVFRQER